MPRHCFYKKKKKIREVELKDIKEDTYRETEYFELKGTLWQRHLPIRSALSG